MRRSLTRQWMKDSLIRMIQEKVLDAFGKTRSKVPVRTGALKSSGSTNDIPNGAELRYSKEYASFVERGFKGGRIHVPTYYRRDGTRVRAYDYYSPPRPPGKFIENSMEESFSSAADVFDRNLKIHFRRVVRV